MQETKLQERVKDIETQLYHDHAIHPHLYTKKIHNIVELFKLINTQNYYYVALKIKKRELALDTINKLISKKQQLQQLDQTISKKNQSKKTIEYDPLNTKSVKKTTKTIYKPILVDVIKPKNTSNAIAFYPTLYPEEEPILEKKVKVQEESDDEMLIRVNDGLQGSTEDKFTLYCATNIILIDKQVQYKVALLLEMPTFRILCETLEIKYFPAQQTITYLQQNLERKIAYGQVQMTYGINSPEYLLKLSTKLLNNDKIVAQKYDNDNSTIVLLHMTQLQQILKSRKQTLNFTKTALVVKEWVDSSYTKWWAQNYSHQEHNLFFLIYYKDLRKPETRMTKLTLLAPKFFPEIESIHQQQLNKQENDFLLQGFLQAADEPEKPAPAIIEPEPVEPTKPTKPITMKVKITKQHKKQQVDANSEVVVKSQEQQFEPISPPAAPQTYSLLDINSLALQLDQEDYY